MAIPMMRRIYEDRAGRKMIIRAARLRDMNESAQIINSWIDKVEWMPRIHSRQEVTDFYRDIVFTQQQVFVAENDDRIIGLIALSPDNIVSALYVHEDHRKRGVGKALLDRARMEATGPVELWTFVANAAAQAFYKREGFREIRRTDGGNEESLPDILYRAEPIHAGAQP